MLFYDKKMLISGKCYKTIYFHTEITVIKQKLEDYKKRNLTTIKKKKTESKEIEENNEMISCQ